MAPIRALIVPKGCTSSASMEPPGVKATTASQTWLAQTWPRQPGPRTLGRRNPGRRNGEHGQQLVGVQRLLLTGRAGVGAADAGQHRGDMRIARVERAAELAIAPANAGGRRSSEETDNGGRPGPPSMQAAR